MRIPQHFKCRAFLTKCRQISWLWMTSRLSLPSLPFSGASWAQNNWIPNFQCYRQTNLAQGGRPDLIKDLHSVALRHKSGNHWFHWAAQRLKCDSQVESEIPLLLHVSISGSRGLWRHVRFFLGFWKVNVSVNIRFRFRFQILFAHLIFSCSWWEGSSKLCVVKEPWIT